MVALQASFRLLQNSEGFQMLLVVEYTLLMDYPTPATRDGRAQPPDYDTLRIYDDFLGPAPLPPGGPDLRLTEDGKTYYGWWFKKFGYVLTSDADSFFQTVQAISRFQRDAESANFACYSEEPELAPPTVSA
jgi:hypothetical protein